MFVHIPGAAVELSKMKSYFVCYWCMVWWTFSRTPTMDMVYSEHCYN